MRFSPVSAVCLSLMLPLPALAAGTETEAPPKPSPTTQECEEGLIWDADLGECAAPKDTRLNDKTRMLAVRELAYAGRVAEARSVLDSLQDQGSDLALTYRGFVARTLGQTAEAELWYQRALAANPNNLLARSYMGQGYVEQGEIHLARLQLTQIRTRGGRGSWAEISLRMAIERGRGFSY